MSCLRCWWSFKKYFSDDPVWMGRRFRVNWVIMWITASMAGVGYTIGLPSLHQFVTSPKNPKHDIQPGLELNEVWYSFIVSIASIGQLVGALIVGFITRMRLIKFKYIMLTSFVICFIGGILYLFTVNGWMLLIGRFFIGLFQGCFNVYMRAYLGETSTRAIAMLPPEKRAKSNIKNTAFFVVSFLGTVFIAIGAVLSAVASYIPLFRADPFHWPGGYMCIHSGVLFTLVTVFFWENKNDLKSPNKKKSGCGCDRSIYSIDVFGPILFIIFSFFISNWFFATLESQANPLLSDNFGLDIQYGAYCFGAILVMFCLATLSVFILQQTCHLNNKIIFIMGSIISIIGALILTDWQVLIGGDPCTRFSNIQNLTITESNITLQANSSSMWQLHNGLCLEDTLSKNYHFLPGKALECQEGCKEEECFLLEKFAFELPPQEEDDILCLIQPGLERVQCIWNMPSPPVFLELAIATVEELFEEPSGAKVHNGVFSSKNCSSDIAELVGGHQNISGYAAIFKADNTFLCKECELARSASEHCGFTTSGEDPTNSTCPDSDLNCLADKYGVDLSNCILSDITVDNKSSCVCEAFSTVDEYQCFWNQKSRVTGKFCPRCQKACLSTTHSLYFPQLIVGLALFTPAYPIGRLTLSVITSDILGNVPQGFIMSLLVSAGSIARATAPLWGNQAYLVVGRRTWLFTLILAVLLSIVVIGFILLYRKMKPRDEEEIQPLLPRASFTESLMV